MARIFLVRHAQASFGLQNYDRLSDTGRQQAPYLNDHFPEAQRMLIYTGDMQRQQDTAKLAFPGEKILMLPELNEFDHQNVLSVYHTQFSNVGQIAGYLLSQPDPKKAFQKGFEAAMQQWISGSKGNYRESWEEFSIRSVSAMKALMDIGSDLKQDIIAVTSGGVIAAITGHVLELSGNKVLDINWVIANTSVTALLYRSNKVSLAYFNNFQHLPPGLLTYR